jgi:uncharacterized lipoprotein YajG
MGIHYDYHSAKETTQTALNQLEIKKFMKRIVLLLLASLLLCSCIYEDLSNCPNYNQESRDSVKTKSVALEQKSVPESTDTTRCNPAFRAKADGINPVSYNNE